MKIRADKCRQNDESEEGNRRFSQLGERAKTLLQAFQENVWIHWQAESIKAADHSNE